MSNEINTLIRELIDEMELTKEEVEYVKGEGIFAMRLNRIAVTEEQATQTFSHESILRLTQMFHLWILNRINERWYPSGYSKDSVPETFTVFSTMDWSDDQ
tara:strand:- start:2563 stop:2865 length:303 start_codon:yes stop_codon:yes gene_type:complete